VRRHGFLPEKVRQHLTPSPATVIASLALLVACGGTAFGGTPLGGSSAGGQDRRAQPASGKPGPRGPRGPAGPAGPAGAPGSAFAYAHVLSNGQLDPALSKNVDIEDFVLVGVSCLIVTGGTPRNVTATIDNSGADARTSQIAASVAPPGSSTAVGCLSGDNVSVTTSTGGNFKALPFYVVIN